MGHTIEVMDREIEQKEIKIEFLESKIGLPDSNVIEMNKERFKKCHPKEKVIGLWIG